MNFKEAAPKRTLCEVLREINDIISDPANVSEHIATKIRDKLIEVEQMSKKMSIKLRKYNMQYDKDFWKKNPDYLEDLKRRENMSFLDKEQS